MWRIAITTPRRYFTTTTSPTVVSRRAWQAYRSKHPLKIIPKEKASEDNKPWPRSVILTGYVAAGIFIPYFGCWFIASNEAVRQVVFRILPIIETPIRNHFGTEDPDAASYVDNSNTIPLRLADEWPLQIRKEQAVIDELNEMELKIKLHRNGMSNVLQVPASTIARKQDLLSFVDDANNNSVVSIAVDFSAVSKDDSEELTSDIVSDDTITPKDPLLKTASIYSSWHYQQDLTAVQQQQQPPPSNSQVQQSALEYRIQELEQELKNPTRVVDDIVDELDQTKAELRRIKWKKWMPWSS